MQSRGARELWSINGIAVTPRIEVIQELAAHAGVESMRADTLLLAPAVSYGSPALPRWNLGAVHAPDLWALNYTSVGVVVASTVTCTPKQNFRGTEVFQYQMTDNLGAYSNQANVY